MAKKNVNILQIGDFFHFSCPTQLKKKKKINYLQIMIFILIFNTNKILITRSGKMSNFKFIRRGKRYVLDLPLKS